MTPSALTSINTAAVATYAAALSTLLFFWTLYVGITSRRRSLRIEARVRRDANIPIFYVEIRVTNNGWTAIVPTSLTVTSGKGDRPEMYWHAAEESFSRTLERGESSGKLSTNLAAFADPDMQIRVSESLGKTWTLGRRQTRALAEAAKKQVDANSVALLLQKKDPDGKPEAFRRPGGTGAP